MSQITDTSFARITKETLVRGYNTPGSINADNLAYNDNLTIKEKISTITGGEELTSSMVGNIPSGGISSTDVQSALNELDLEKANASNVYTKTESDGKYSLTSHTHTFASLTSKPTTLSGYGITDAYTKTEIDNTIANYYTKTQTDAKYVTLATDQNITGYKTFTADVSVKSIFRVYNPNNTNHTAIWNDGSNNRIDVAGQDLIISSVSTLYLGGVVSSIPPYSRVAVAGDLFLSTGTPGPIKGWNLSCHSDEIKLYIATWDGNDYSDKLVIGIDEFSIHGDNFVGGWTGWVPTVGGDSNNNHTYSYQFSRYHKKGKDLKMETTIQINSKGTTGGFVYINSPYTLLWYDSLSSKVNGDWFSSTGVKKGRVVRYNSTIMLQKEGAYSRGWSQATWSDIADGDTIQLNDTFELA